MKKCSLLLLASIAAPTFAADLMEDCKVNKGRGDMRCINRNGVCIEISIDAHPTKPISRADKQRLAQLPDMDDLCWQVDVPVSAQFRVEGRGGGEVPEFIGPLESIGAQLLPIEDYDPEFDGNRIQPLYAFDLAADGCRDGTWQLREREHFSTPRSGVLEAGEYVVILRLHGRDNWDKQMVLVRIDPTLKPSVEKAGTKSAECPAQRS